MSADAIQDIMVTVKDSWEQICEPLGRSLLEARLPDFLGRSRWFGGKGRRIQSTEIRETVSVLHERARFVLLFVQVRYADGNSDLYCIPVTAAFGPDAERIERECEQAVIEKITLTGSLGEQGGVLYDAVWNEEAASLVVHSIGSAMRFSGSKGTVTGSPTRAFPATLLTPPIGCVTVMKGEQSNTSLRVGDQAMMKLYRRLQNGVNPDLEIGRVLTARGFRHTPAVLGALEYSAGQQEPTTIVILQQFMPNKGDGWRYTLDELQGYFDRIIAKAPTGPDVDPSGDEPSAPAPQLVGDYLQAATCLGQRTAELHLILAQSTGDKAFDPVPCTADYLRARYESMQRLCEGAMMLLRESLARLSETDRVKARQVLDGEQAVMSRLRAVLTAQPAVLRIRCHGDFHLGQVLYTDRDFVIIDFEGEPARPLAERRTKHLPIVDVAGMIRSFHYAAHAALRERVAGNGGRNNSDLEFWVRAWYRTARTAFVESYMQHVAVAPLQPRSERERALLLDVHLLEKAVYELGYELNNRPAWVAIPLQGILEIMKRED